MIVVQHNKNFLDFSFSCREDKLKEMANDIKPEDLEIVAEVDGFNLDDAFRLTNHIDHAWQKNKGIKVLSNKARSTSVGDIMIRDGKRYIVAGCGFVEI